MRTMSIVHLSFYFVLCSFTSVMAQPIDGGKKNNSLLIRPNGPYLLLKNQVPSRSMRVKNDKEEQYRLTGYVYEIGRPKMQKSAEVKLDYSLPGLLKYSYFYANDTSEIKQYVMDRDFDYNYEDMLSTINPGGLGSVLLRSQENVRGLNGHFSSMESRQKIDGKWRSNRKISDRIEVPYGIEYGKRYAFETTCPYIWESNSTGGWKDGYWLDTLEVTLINCETFIPKQSAREVRKYDEKHQQVELISYDKLGDQYVQLFRYRYKYDEQGREIERIIEGDNPEPEKVKKYIQSYDEKENYIMSRFILIGSEWIQTFRTITERSDDGSYVYTFQFFKEDAWQNSWMEKYRYDTQGRLISWKDEKWDNNFQQWTLRSQASHRYFADNLPSEQEYYSAEFGDGYKWLAEYDENKMLKFSQTFACSNNQDCEQGNYMPTYRAYYENRDSDDLDYFNSYRFTGNEWVRFDSVANIYNERGEIAESFWRMYEGNYPEKIDLQQRYIYQYDKFIVTALDQEMEFNSTLYPNPSTGIININTPSNTLGSISLIDSNAHSVGELRFQKIDDTQYTADISHLKPGIYFLKRVVKGKVRVHKIVKN